MKLSDIGNCYRLLSDGVRYVTRGLDPGLGWLLFAIMGFGLVMMTSASLTLGERLAGDAMYYFNRQAITVVMGIVIMLGCLHVPLVFWQKYSPWWLFICIVLLLVLLLPGVGHTVNGSTRWLQFGPVSFQISEYVKVAALVYFAAYLNRKGVLLGESFLALLLPFALLAVICGLIVVQPDFGTAVVLFVAIMGMVFLGGVHWVRFLSWVVGVGGATFVVLAVGSQYRMARLISFMDPWSDPFNQGFQLTQALIAYGRGGIWGQGLGGSMQKMFYLPEAHTDFIHAVIAEELGLPGSLLLLGLFAALVWQCFRLARMAVDNNHMYAAYIAWGTGLFIGLQAGFNIGVSMGVLPTKGITLPFISYGNNSILAQCIMVGILLRVAREVPVVDGKKSHV